MTLVREALLARLNEVAPAADSHDGAGWDENVGARLVYRLIAFALRSRA